MVDYILVSEVVETFAVSLCVLSVLCFLFGLVVFEDNSDDLKGKIKYAIFGLFVVFFASCVITAAGFKSDVELAHKFRIEAHYKRTQDAQGLKTNYLRAKLKSFLEEENQQKGDQ